MRCPQISKGECSLRGCNADYTSIQTMLVSFPSKNLSTIDSSQIFGESFEIVKVHQSLDQQPLCERTACTVCRLNQISDRIAAHCHVFDESQDWRAPQSNHLLANLADKRSLECTDALRRLLSTVAPSAPARYFRRRGPVTSCSKS